MRADGSERERAGARESDRAIVKSRRERRREREREKKKKKKLYSREREGEWEGGGESDPSGEIGTMRNGDWLMTDAPTTTEMRRMA